MNLNAKRTVPLLNGERLIYMIKEKQIDKCYDLLLDELNLAIEKTERLSVMVRIYNCPLKEVMKEIQELDMKLSGIRLGLEKMRES